MQIYFLSIFSSLLCVLVFFFSNSVNFPTRDAKTEEIAFFSQKSFRLFLGIFAVLIGFCKIFLPCGRPVFFADFLIVLANLFAGLVFLTDYYFATTTLPVDDFSNSAGKFSKIIATIFENQRYCAILILVIAILHFFFPQVLFL